MKRIQESPELFNLDDMVSSLGSNPAFVALRKKYRDKGAKYGDSMIDTMYLESQRLLEELSRDMDYELSEDEIEDSDAFYDIVTTLASDFFEGLSENWPSGIIT